MKSCKLLVLLTVLSLLLPALLYSQVDTAWVRRYNGPPGTSSDGAYAIAVDGAGNVYVTGRSNGGPVASYDYLTIKYNSAGDTLWVRRYNGPVSDLDAARAIAVDGAGNVYVTGSSSGGPGTINDYATIKYNSVGDTLWVRRYNGPANGTDMAYAIAVDGAGNVYVTGHSAGDGTGPDYLTIKYDSSGVEQWVARYNGLGNGIDAATAMAVDGAGNVYVTGHSFIALSADNDYLTIKYNSDGDTLWVRRYTGPVTVGDWDKATAIAVDGAGNVYVTGSSIGDPPPGPGNDYATIKYDSSGAEQWVARYNGPGNGPDYAYAIAVDGAGNVYVTGQSEGTGAGGVAGEDYATVKYNSAGDTLWVRRYNGPVNNSDKATAMAVDGAGNVYVTGQSTGFGTDVDYATIKYNSDGDERWVARYNGPGNGFDAAAAIAVDVAGNIYVTGNSVGPGTGADYATIKYVQAGAIIEEPIENCKLKIANCKLEVYPNPAKSFFVVRVPQSAQSRVDSTGLNTLNATRYTLKMFDVSGKLIKEITVKGEKTIPLKDIESGVFFIKVGDNLNKLTVLK